MRSFKDLEVWKDSKVLVKDIYILTSTLPEAEKYGLISQIRRAAVSIPSNIAEGSGKDSKKDFARFLQISLGSSYELESHLLLCQDLNFISEELNIQYLTPLSILQKKIYNFIRYLNQ
jgi:four helix bundle protein